jgi:hypothetical protein
VEAGKVTTVKIDSGIELAGRDENSPPLRYWYVYDADNSERYLTYVAGKWGTTPLPPGEYMIGVTPGDFGAREVRWKQVTVEAGKVTTVKIDSGIKLAGHGENSPPLRYWYVYDADDSERYLTYVAGKWGTTPLPPGKYVVGVTPGEFGARQVRWNEVTVEAGKVTTVKIDSGIELTGADKDSPPPEHWYVYDAKDADSYLTYVSDKWGTTPLPPGDYVVKVRMQDSRYQIPWDEVRVNSHQVPTLQIDPADKASLGGKYRDLLHTIKVEQDAGDYGVLHDFGFANLPRYEGHAGLAPGYWVYLAPNWYIWGKKVRQERAPATTAEELDTASGGGKYHDLLRKIHAPQDEDRYGTLNDYGFTNTIKYGEDANLSFGYWVYSRPNWYIWRAEADPEAKPRPMVEPADRAAEAGTSGRLRGGTIGADFVFVIDGSSSMSGKINRVIEGLNAFVTHLHSVGVDARFAVVVYGGEPELVLDFTTSIDATKAALEKVTIGAVPGFQNNHDLNPEAGLEAIRAVLGAAARPLAIDHVGGSTRLRFRETARKNLILVTDEDSDIPCHGENRLPGQTSLAPPNEIADTSWQREVDLTAQAVIENQAFVNLLINPEEQPSRFQYGDPDSSVADAKLLNFDAQATLSRLKENGYGKCLEAQVLKAGLIGRAFNVSRVGDENFVKNFFAAKVEEVAKRANVARLTVVHQGGALPPALMPAWS